MEKTCDYCWQYDIERGTCRINGKPTPPDNTCAAFVLCKSRKEKP